TTIAVGSASLASQA
ncbi:hypothetical protein ECTT12B_2501, partial [Escherichia coli TT12B]